MYIGYNVQVHVEDIPLLASNQICVTFSKFSMITIINIGLRSTV